MTDDYFVGASGMIVGFNCLYEEYSKLRKARMITNDNQTFILYVNRVIEYLPRSKDIMEAMILGHNAHTYEVYLHSDTKSLI